MWKVIKWLLATLWTLSSGLAVYVFYQWIANTPQNIQNLPRFLSLLSAHKLILLTGLLVLAVLALISFKRDARQELAKKVWFYKSCWRLKPSDINPSPAWYDPFFIDRPAVAEAVKLLTAGQGVMLVGVPLLGKTRCAYQVLKSLRRHHVLGLGPQNTDLAAIRIPRSFMIFKPDLILFFDDLQRYLEKIDPLSLHRHLLDKTSSLAVLATCRSGKELETVRADASFGSFVNQNMREVRPDELSKKEEKDLARHFRREWNKTAFNGTPGSIVFNLELMRERLDTSGTDTKTLMRSLYIMRKSGIRTYRRTVIEQVAKKIYELNATRPVIEEAWQGLKEAGFLAIEKEIVTPTHAVYLESSFYPDYDFGDPAKDIEALWQLLLEKREAQEIYDISIYSLTQHNEQKAEQGLKKYLELVPINVNAHYFLGNVLKQREQFGDAEKEYREAIRLDPDDDKGHFGLGGLFRDQKNYAEAEKEYREAIRLDPDDHAYHTQLGFVMSSQMQIEEAEKEYREAIRLDPNYKYSHFLLALLLKDKGRIEEAEKELREAIRCDADYADAHQHLGILLHDQGRIEEAEEELGEAMRLDPQDSHTRLSLGNLFRSRGNYAKAEKEYREAMRLDPQDSQLHFVLGVLFSNQDNQVEAEKEFREAVRLDPCHSASHSQLGFILLSRMQIEEAEKEYREAIRLDPNDKFVHFLLAMLLKIQERIEEAEKELREAIRCDAEYTSAHQQLAELLQKQGRTEEAEKELREAKRLERAEQSS